MTPTTTGSTAVHIHATWPAARRRTYRTWMISTGEGDYLGRYWVSRPVSPWLEGHVQAAWRTRAEARAELPRARRSYPKASVRRVTVTITDVS